MSNGSIVFNTKIDNSNVEKDLKDVERKIRSAEQSISKNESAKLPLIKQAEELGAKLDEAKRNLVMLQDEMAAIQSAMGPGSDPADFVEAFANLDKVKLALDDQQKEVDSLQKEWDKVNDKVDDYNKKIQSSKSEIGRCQEEVGRLRAKLGHGKNSMSEEFKKAERSAGGLGKRLLNIGLSVLVFNQISAGLRNATGYMRKMLQTNSEYTKQMVKIKAALLAAFQPIYEFVLPGLIAVLKVVTQIATVIGKGIAWLFGKDYKQMVKNSQALYNQSNAIAAVGDAATKASKSLAGFDEINRLSGDSKQKAPSGNIAPDFDGLDDDTDGIMGKLKDILGLVTAIGIGFLSWKLSKSLIPQLGWIAGLALPAAGLAMFVSDMKDFFGYMHDFLANGATLENVVGMLSEFSGSIGDIFLALGKLKIGGALKVIQGIGEIFNGVRDIFKNGFNWDNVYTSVKGFTNVIAGVSAMLGKLNITGFAIAVQGAFGAIKDIAKNWDAIKSGDLSVFKSVDFITNIIKAIAGLALGLGAISKIKGAAAAKNAADTVKTLSDSTSEFGNAMKGSLAPRAKSIAAACLWGMAAIAEVCAAVLLIAGTIVLLGKALSMAVDAWEPVIQNAGTAAIAIAASVVILAAVGAACFALGKVGKTVAVNIAIGMAVMLEIAVAALLFAVEVAVLGAALDAVANAWNPVIGNGETAKTAILVGSALLIGIGTVCFALGSVGKTAAVNIAIGAAVMVEIAIATALFIAEIYVIGMGLQALATAWEPVIQNGDTVKTAILSGTAMLAAVGAAAAALGAITIASGGTIPLAIAIGTAVLVEMAAALVAFTESIVVVANQLSGSLAPAMSRANAVLPGLTSNMANFTQFMSDFATQAWNYTKSTAISTFASVVDSIIQMFAGNPIERFASNVDAIGEQVRSLNEKLQVAIPELQMACILVSNYQMLVQKLNSLLGMDMTITDGAFANMHELGVTIVTGIAEGMVEGQAALLAATESTMNILTVGFVVPVQELFSQLYLQLNTMTMQSAQLISTAFVNCATTISTVFIQGIGMQFMTFFMTQKTNVMDLQMAIQTMAMQSRMNIITGFIMPVLTQMSQLVNQLKVLFSQLKAEIISGFQQAAGGTRAAFAGVPGWFSSSVCSPIMSMIHQMISEMTSAIAQANAAIASMQARTYSARATAARYGRTRFFANGGTLRSGWGIVGEVGPELIHMVGGKAVITPLNVPRLASGAVLPANKPFMAMVGDQTHGTNIEAPLDTIKQAVYEVFGDMEPAMMAGFEAVVQAIQEKNMAVSIGDRDIGEAYDRYNRRMGVRRG